MKALSLYQYNCIARATQLSEAAPTIVMVTYVRTKTILLLNRNVKWQQLSFKSNKPIVCWKKKTCNKLKPGE